jgi:hypothetical protein
MSFFDSWLEHGITEARTEARTELDGAAIGEAALRAVTLWPGEPANSIGEGSSSARP